MAPSSSGYLEVRTGSVYLWQINARFVPLAGHAQHHLLIETAVADVADSPL